MPDVTALSTLQVAAIRRMTDDPAMADRCDACLRERGVRGIQYVLINLFAGLGAGCDAFLAYDWDDEDVPTPRVLIWSGAIVTALIAGFFSFMAFAFIHIRSWWGRGLAATLPALSRDPSGQAIAAGQGRELGSGATRLTQRSRSWNRGSSRSGS